MTSACRRRRFKIPNSRFQIQNEFLRLLTSYPRRMEQHRRLFYAQRSIDLSDGVVHVFERFLRKAGAGFAKQTLSGPELGVGGSLRFVDLAVAANFSARFAQGEFDLFHRANTMAFVIMFSLRKCRVRVV